MNKILLYGKGPSSFSHVRRFNDYLLLAARHAIFLIINSREAVRFMLQRFLRGVFHWQPEAGHTAELRTHFFLSLVIPCCCTFCRCSCSPKSSRHLHSRTDTRSNQNTGSLSSTTRSRLFAQLEARLRSYTRSMRSSIGEMREETVELRFLIFGGKWTRTPPNDEHSTQR